jgi:hypothetical protein
MGILGVIVVAVFLLSFFFHRIRLSDVGQILLELDLTDSVIDLLFSGVYLLLFFLHRFPLDGHLISSILAHTGAHHEHLGWRALTNDWVDCCDWLVVVHGSALLRYWIWTMLFLRVSILSYFVHLLVLLTLLLRGLNSFLDLRWILALICFSSVEFSNLLGSDGL